jgi:hypothetical protein
LSGAQESLESLKMEMDQIREKLTAFATGNEAMAADLQVRRRAVPCGAVK